MKLAIVLAIAIVAIVVTLFALRVASGWRLEPYWHPSPQSATFVVS